MFKWLTLAALALLASIPSSANILRGGSGGATPPPPPGCAGAPFTNSCAAATWTADNNTTCQALYPFYWEIGNVSGPMVWDGSIGGTPITGVAANSLPAINSTTFNQWDSSSKWFMGMYVAQLRGGDANLTAADIAALNQSDGYANSATDTCPSSDTLATCLTIVNAGVYDIHSAPNAPCGNPNPQFSNFCNQPQSYQNPADIGVFFYSGSHFINEAENATPLSTTPPAHPLPPATLTAQIVAELTNGCACTLTLTGACVAPFTSGTQLPELCAQYQSGNFAYGGVNVAGQATGTAIAYRSALKGILAHQLYMYQSLDNHLVCANPGGNYTSNPPGGTSCNSPYSPITTVNQHYSIGHWVEDWYNSSSNYGDGAYSSPGAKGYYEWIDTTVTYYGVIARVAASGGQGQITEKCGALIRNAFTCGVNQTTGEPVPCSPFGG